MQALRERIMAYAPTDAREARDRELLLLALDTLQTPLTRDNPFAHFTASSWIVNPARDRALMAWHNIYKTWSWTGGLSNYPAEPILRETREEKKYHLLSYYTTPF